MIGLRGIQVGGGLGVGVDVRVLCRLLGRVREWDSGDGVYNLQGADGKPGGWGAKGQLFTSLFLLLGK